MSRLSVCLLLCLAVAGAAPAKQDLQEDINQLMKRFMFDNYDYDYSVDDHHEDETPEEHKRHTTTNRPAKRQQRKTQAQKQKELRERQRKEQEQREKEQEQREKELREQQENQRKEREEKELKEVKQAKDIPQNVASEEGIGAVDPQLREFTLIISKLLFHLSQM